MFRTGFVFLLALLPGLARAQDTAGFRLCPSAGNYPYYFPKLKYPGGFWEIKNHFYTGYDGASFHASPHRSGIVTIHFWVNCEGVAGGYVAETFDLQYRPAPVDGRIVAHLLELVGALKGWIPGRLENGENVNHHAFLTFRIEDGLLTDLFPFIHKA